MNGLLLWHCLTSHEVCVLNTLCQVEHGDQWNQSSWYYYNTISDVSHGFTVVSSPATSWSGLDCMSDWDQNEGMVASTPSVRSSVCHCLPPLHCNSEHKMSVRVSSNINYQSTTRSKRRNQAISIKDQTKK